jgi:Carboxypeptidase regulatory-like domain
MTMTGQCTSHVRSRGPVPQLPVAPSLRSGYGAVIGTLADSGGALPHYTVLAAAPGDSPDSPHASAMADSAGGFVINLLPPGRYRLVVRAYAHRPDSTAVDIVAGEIDTVRMMTQFFQCLR